MPGEHTVFSRHIWTYPRKPAAVRSNPPLSENNDRHSIGLISHSPLWRPSWGDFTEVLTYNDPKTFCKCTEFLARVDELIKPNVRHKRRRVIAHRLLRRNNIAPMPSLRHRSPQR